MASRARPKRARVSPFALAEQYCDSASDQEGFNKCYIDANIGYGLFTTKCFQKGTFLLEYRGKILQATEEEEESNLDYMFYFKHNGNEYRIDASEEDACMARWINDEEKKPNCVMKKHVFKGKVHLCLFALADIGINEELRYNYGMKDLPWRQRPCRMSPLLERGTETVTDSARISFPHHPLEEEIERLHLALEQSLSLENPDPDKAMQIMAQVDQMIENHVTSSLDAVLKKHIGFIRTMKKICRYKPSTMVSNTALSLFNKLKRHYLEAKSNTNKTCTEEIQESSRSGHVKSLLEHADNNMEQDEPHFNSQNSQPLETELAPELAAADRLCSEQHQKYADLHSVPLVGISETLEAPHSQSAELTSQLDSTHHEHEEAKRLRQAFPVQTFEVEQAVDTAEGQLVKPITNVPQAMQEHEPLETELAPELAAADRLCSEQHQKYADLHSVPPVGISETLEALHSQIAELTSQLDSTRHELEEAKRLRQAFPVQTFEVEQAVDTAEGQLVKPITNVPQAMQEHEVIDSEEEDEELDPIPGLPRRRPVALVHSDEDDSDPDYCPSSEGSYISLACSESAHPEEDGTYVFFDHSKKTQPQDGKKQQRVYDKRNVCLYCEKRIEVKIGRHYLSCHAEEPQVAQISVLPIASKERKAQLELLRHRGNFYHNERVISTGKGELILSRRPAKSDNTSEVDDFTPCPQCLGYVKKTNLWRHCTYRCIARKSGGPVEGRGYLEIQSEMLQHPDSFHGASASLKKVVLPSMKNDDITQVCKGDPIILEHGNQWLKKLGASKKNLVSSKMRNGAALLLELRKSQKGTSMSDFLTAGHFNLVIEAVETRAGNIDLDEEEEDLCRYEHPSTAVRLGHDLVRLASIKKCLAIRKNDPIAEKEARGYLEVHEDEFGIKIAAGARSMLEERKFNNPATLPTTEEVKTLSTHIVDELKHKVDGFENATQQDYKQLQKLTLARLITFNRRRPGESAALKVRTYKERPDWHTARNDEVEKSLSSVEKQLLRSLDLVEIRGKRGRKVPLIIPPLAKRALGLIVEQRAQFGMLPSNKYIFGIPGKKTHIRGNDAVASSCKSAGLKGLSPETLKSTNMRKYVGTVTQVLALPENELDWVANHLGHDIRIHRHFYRLTDSTIELAKVSKLLIAMDHGKLGDCAGKTLDDIDLGDIPWIEESEAGDCEPTETGHHSQTEQGAEESQPDVSKPKVNGHPPQTKQGNASRRKWTKQETDAIWDGLGEFIKRKKVPGKEACLQCQGKFRVLSEGRHWKEIKYKINNIINSIKQKQM